MTLSSTDNKISHAGDGVTTTPFSFPFLFFADADLTVILRASGGTETIQVLNTDYTVTGAGTAAGFVSMTVAPAGPPNADTLVILREVAAIQGVDYRAGDPFPADTHETALDRLTMLIQQMQEEFTRTPSVSKTDQATSLVLPNELQRASKFFAFDASGNAIASSGPTGDSSIPVSAYIETLLDDANAAATRTTLGLGTAAVVSTGAADANVPTGTNLKGTAREFSKAQNFAATSLTDATNIAWDLESNQVSSVTLAGNRTLDNPTSMQDGGTYILIVKQDGTGSRTLAYGTAYKFPSGTAPTLSTGANAVDILTFLSDGTSMYGVAQLDLQ